VGGSIFPYYFPFNSILQTNILLISAIRLIIIQANLISKTTSLTTSSSKYALTLFNCFTVCCCCCL